MPTHPMAALINISLELEMPTPSADTFSNTADLAAIASNLPFVFLWNAAVVVRCKIGVAILAPLTGIAVALGIAIERNIERTFPHWERTLLTITSARPVATYLSIALSGMLLLALSLECRLRVLKGNRLKKHP